MYRTLLFALATIALLTGVSVAADAQRNEEKPEPTFTMRPIGWVHKSDQSTSIVLEETYEPGLLGVDNFKHIWVFYWLDHNDTPDKRSILQVHPEGSPNAPLQGVFATHAPVRPNLIALSRCKVISVKENVVEIDAIDAFPNTPVMDLKPCKTAATK
ncbi:MAG: SAM-dependent methyltransferase [Planctomycetes bacterium]|nr:SAM-dependent methyltransferase [Planctomycetota bacterium]